jgi:signal transduction histidine kinase
MVGHCLKDGTLYRRVEVESITTNGLTKRLGATIAPIEWHAERGPHGALCLLTDITEVTELKEQLALKNSLESLGEMSAGLAHEFKNAVAAMQGYVQLIQTQNLEAKAAVTAGALLNEVQSLSTMVTSFLNFARPQPLHVEDVSMKELIEECISELSPLFEQKRVELVADSLTDFTVQADERMLRQTLLNLLRNAAESIPENSLRRSVFLDVDSETDSTRRRWIVIEIKDTGSGIAPHELKKIFIPFFTTKAEGHGVGLALSHRVISQHGGTLTAHNVIEGGAVFTIRLPMSDML